jgi:hypothetical protein
MGLAKLPVPANYVPFQHRVLGAGLAPGTVTSNGGTNSEVLPIANTRYVTVRVKTTGNGGSLAFDFVRPVATENIFSATDGSIVPANVIKYTAPASPSALTVTSAGTEYSSTITCNGEMFLLLTYTGATGAGTIAYCDVSGL